MIFLMDPEFWARVFGIIIIDLTLAGDNALVIALAVRTLPKRQQLLGRIWGTLGAVGLRPPRHTDESVHLGHLARRRHPGLRRGRDDPEGSRARALDRSLDAGPRVAAAGAGRDHRGARLVAQQSGWQKEGAGQRLIQYPRRLWRKIFGPISISSSGASPATSRSFRSRSTHASRLPRSSSSSSAIG